LVRYCAGWMQPRPAGNGDDMEELWGEIYKSLDARPLDAVLREFEGTAETRASGVTEWTFGKVGADVQGDESFTACGGHRVFSWNGRGLNARIKSGELVRALRHEKPDTVFFSETLCNADRIYCPAELSNFMLAMGYRYAFIHSNISSVRAGAEHFGCALFTKFKPTSVTYGVGHAESDKEGRTIIAKFKGLPRFVFTYSPCTKVQEYEHPLRRAHDDRLRELAAEGDTVIMGDLNVAPTDADCTICPFGEFIPGCKEYERESFRQLLN